MTDNKNIFSGDLSLLRQIPNVLRARGFRLYLANGKRIVDLWLNGGAAVLGHTPANMLRELKNTASRGLFAPFPHFTENRFLKALLKLFPGHSFRLYASPPVELTESLKNETVKFWRPYIEPKEPFATNNIPLFIPILPGIQTWRDGMPMGLCIVAAKSQEHLSQLPPNDLLSPILLAVATRGIYNIIAAPERANPKLPRVEKELKNNSQSIWQKQGIYLILKEKPTLQEWNTLFNKFFEAGFLLPPAPSFPLILPGELSDGEEVKLVSVLC
ncbi:MAG: hypothetical protein FWD24_03465 [Treponema sp.]|nr:hypothetical protein [Treponema sp.]